ncbi:MAG: hypothetical protein QFX38_04495 [Methanothermobacter sp.]|nr:hypothetical protein [Methanothermobacter sp.]
MTLLLMLGVAIGMGTVSAQKNEEGDIEIIDLDEGNLDENVEATDFDSALDHDIMNDPAESEGQEAVAGSVPMQPTGVPLLPALISALMISSGLLVGARYKF